MNINEFFHFSGIHYGDTIDQVLDLLGAPDDQYKNSDNSYFVLYYESLGEFALNISLSSSTFKVESIFLGLHSQRAVNELMKKFNIHEPKASFIGKTMDEIIDCFGIPNEKKKTFISYSEKNIEVEFYYPRNEKLQCKRIKVKWFYPRGL